MTNPDDLYFSIVDGDRKSAVDLTQNALASGIQAQALVDDDLIPAMKEVGRRFEEEEIFVPELLLSANAMKGALDLIRPILAQGDAEPCGYVVIGTVKGDLHDIGKNLVTALLEGAGFEITDLGVDVSVDKFVAAIKEVKPDVVGLSALLTVSMPSMKKTIDAISEAGLRDRVKIMIGGAPISANFAENIGADGFAENAAAAVRTAHRLVAELDKSLGIPGRGMRTCSAQSGTVRGKL